jgi:peptidoglycan/xylan/chitin deacetylase (PgdA/CDA1 family)
MTNNLWSANSPQRFWSCYPDPPSDIWDEATRRAACLLKLSGELIDIDEILEYSLGERQFGSGRYKMGTAKRLYYRVKPFVPRSLISSLRRLYNRAKDQSFPLGWPVEARFAEFQWEILRQVMLLTDLEEVAFKYFWPGGKSFAFILTHDVETARGQRLVPVLADMEEELGFRSIFNFVPELYPVDRGLVQDLLKRGFEIGIHGLKHDGKLFDTYSEFTCRAERINHHLHEFQAIGFRSPLTLRNPEWMQMLDIEYDLSFFDTDPYEPMPGGVMSLWPFKIGHFLELPYTLPQDSTLFKLRGETSPRIWLEKIKLIEKYHGMALVIVHPDYSAEGVNRSIYQDFLFELKARANYWHALPRDVAHWWKQRMDGDPKNADPAATMAHARLNGNTLEIVVEHSEYQQSSL